MKTPSQLQYDEDYKRLRIMVCAGRITKEAALNWIKVFGKKVEQKVDAEVDKHIERTMKPRHDEFHPIDLALMFKDKK